MNNNSIDGYIGYLDRGFQSDDINVSSNLFIYGNTHFSGDLTVYGDTSFNKDVSVNNIFVNGNVTAGQGFSNSADKWSKIGNDISNNNSGNVGIKTVSPEYKLDVNSSLRSTREIRTPIIYMGGGSSGDISYNNSVIEPRVYGGVDRTEMLIFKGNEASGINGPDRIRVRGGAIAFDTYPSELANPPSPFIRQTENIRMYINNSGNIGIDNTSPSYRLDVSGNTLNRFTSLPNSITSIITTEGLCIASNGRMWVVGGSGTNPLAYSYDGNIWYISTYNGGTTFFSKVSGVAWGNNLWIAVGQGAATVARSTDGINWTNITPATVQVGTSVAYGNNIWVIGGVKNNFVSGYFPITYSKNASPSSSSDWSGAETSNSIFTAYVNTVKWNGSVWLAGGEYYSPPFGTGTSNMARSTNGITWTAVTSAPFFNSSSTSLVNGLAYSLPLNRWVAVGGGSGGTIAYSNDVSGTNWVAIGNSIFFSRGIGVDYNGTNRFVAAGYVLNSIATSTDGITWSGNSSGNSLFNVQGNAVKYDASFNRWFAAGTSTNRLISSTNGLDWRPQIPFSIPYYPNIRINSSSNETALNLFNTNQYKITAANTGNLNIANSAGTAFVTIDTLGNFGIGYPSPNTSYKFSVNGTAAKNTGSSWDVLSDERIKENIENANLQICYNIIKKLPLYYFKWIDKYNTNIKDKHEIGYIAQEVKEYFPKSVTINKMVYGDKIIDDIHILNIDQIIKCMYGTIQFLMNDFELMENRINYLKNEISDLIKKNK